MNGYLPLALGEDCGVGTPSSKQQGSLASSAERLAAAVSPALCPQEHRGLLSIRYPMEHGIVKDWNDMERIWQYVYSKDQLQTFSEEVRVLCVGQPCRECRARQNPYPRDEEDDNSCQEYLSLNYVPGIRPCAF